MQHKQPDFNHGMPMHTGEMQQHNKKPYMAAPSAATMLGMMGW
jgi:hypothetical protein